MSPTIRSNNATYTEENIDADYNYVWKTVQKAGDHDYTVGVSSKTLSFRTQRKLPKLGVLLVGLGGNNGTTLIAGSLANKLKLRWRTKRGDVCATWYGSLLMCSTIQLGLESTTQNPLYVTLPDLLPFISPDTIVYGGWDLNDMPLGDAMRRAAVLDIGLQDQLYPLMQEYKPLPGVYRQQFIAANQSERANHCLNGTLMERLEALRSHIREFKHNHQLDKVIILWTATTERYVDVIAGVHDTSENLLAAVKQEHSEISPSILYAMAGLLENCSIINGAPQNTFVPGLIELAKKQNCFVAGDDFKTGQTKLKSVLTEFLISAGIKPRSIVSYNHLGNNDGQNLSSPLQFQSKNISKSTVIDDMIKSNHILYPNENSKPDHCVVIKYVPYVGDSKRALDEYTSEIFLNGSNTLVIHNTCEDSLLATPVMLDLILLMEFFERVTVKCSAQGNFEPFHTVLSVLSYFVKAPLVPENMPVSNGLNAQRMCIINILLAVLGLPPQDHMNLQHRIPFLMDHCAV